VKNWMVLPCTLLLAGMLTAQTNLSLPEGTAMTVKLETTLATFSNKPGDPFQGRISQPVIVDGQTVIPVGATVEGRVTKVADPRRIQGKPTIGVLPEAVILPNGERYMLDAALVDTNAGRGSDVNRESQFKGAGHDGKDMTEIGMGTGGGMLLGGLIGGGKGLVIGGLVGATATVAHWMGKHRDATLPAGTEMTLELNRPLTMTSATAAPGQ
jgi:hypothetical protein